MDRDDDDFGTHHREEDMEAGYKPSNELDLNANSSDRTLPSKEYGLSDEILQVGSEFESDEHAYRYYNKYARLVGFSVRKDWVNRSKVHGLVVSRKFTCSREGYRRKDKRDSNVKKHRKETRTGCLAHMIVTRQPNCRYRVTHFEEQHNHDYVDLSSALTLPLQGDLGVDRSAEDLGSQSQSAFEEMNRQFKIRDSLADFSCDYDNHLQTERIRDMKEGEAGRLMHYFQRQHFENPSFFYALQLDIDDKVSNIFWSDDNMVSDYGHFGDVICFDSIFRSKKDHFPIVLFLGINHHKQVVIFAAGFLYDDSVESFKWLFCTFLEAMSGKKPRVLYTEQDAALVEAVNSVLPEIDHSSCVWQMYENALKHLNNVVTDSESFASDLRSCIYDFSDEEDFVQAWEKMLNKHSLQQNEWLKWMFREREKWAVVYGRNTFFVDRGFHLGEILCNDLKAHLNSDLDMLQFYKHFERLVESQRCKEIEASDDMHRSMPKLMGNVILLKHASEIYTPKAFEVFQQGYEKCLNVVVNPCGENGTLFEYKANKFGQTREYNLTFDSSDNSIVCSCKKFENIGFLCSHALKVLDHRNIKVVPPRYILKRWTKDARLLSPASEDTGLPVHPKMIVASRYKAVCSRILKLSARASESDEAFLFASRHLDGVIEGVEKILRSKPEEAQAITSSSESDQGDIFLDGNALEDHNESGTKETESRDILDICHPSEKGTTSHGIDNEKALSVYVPHQVTAETPAMQGIYSFEANQVVKCIYQQPNLVVDHQADSSVYQPPSFYTNQHGLPSQPQLLHEPLIHESFPESVANASQLRQEMEVEMEHQDSASFLLYDQRYRASDDPYLGQK